jgi:hypothetical protein
LQAKLAKVEASAMGHRADFERERERADRLMTELLRPGSTANWRPCGTRPWWGRMVGVGR